MSSIYIIIGVLGLAYTITMLIAIIKIWRLLDELVSLQNDKEKD